jgi:hypothetical protein
MPRPGPNLHAELIDARQKLLRQIAILQAGPSYMPRPDVLAYNARLIAELTATLRRIEDELAGL